MATRLYRRYLQLFNQWPLDPSKGRGRDLGQHIRNRVAITFSHGESTEIPDHGKCQDILSSLERIANDTYYLPSDAKISTSSGLTPESCSLLTSDQAQELMRSQEEDTIKLLTYSFHKKLLK